MTAILEKVFAKAGRLSEAAQKQLARQLLEDIEGELKWDKTLADSQVQLEKNGEERDCGPKKGQDRSQGI